MHGLPFLRKSLRKITDFGARKQKSTYWKIGKIVYRKEMSI